MKREDFNRFYYNSIYSAGYDCAEKMGTTLASEVAASDELKNESVGFQKGFMMFIETHK